MQNLKKAPHPHTLPFVPGQLRYIKTSQLVEDTYKLVPFVPTDCRGIIGVPRSGLIPATVLATALHLPLYEVTSGGIRLLSSGSRGHHFATGKGKFFLCEDSSHNGGSMRRARAAIKEPCIFACVYALHRQCKEVDLYAVHLPSPHVFAWNIWNNPLVSGGRAIDPRLRSGFAFDFDGILCQDSTFEHTDEEEARVVNWILNATPKHTPRLPVLPLVISFRLEKHRCFTEEWLRRYKMRVRKMIFYPADSFQDRRFDVAGHKGLNFKQSPQCIFFESDPKQAPIIAGVSGKPVIVPDTSEVFLP